MNTFIIILAAANQINDIDGFAICIGGFLMVAAIIRAIWQEEKFTIEEREREEQEKKNRKNRG